MSQYNPYTFWNYAATPLRPSRWVRRIVDQLVRLEAPPRTNRSHARFMNFAREVYNLLERMDMGVPWYIARRLATAIVHGISYDAICWEFMYNQDETMFETASGDSDDEDFGLSYFFTDQSP